MDEGTRLITVFISSWTLYWLKITQFVAFPHGSFICDQVFFSKLGTTFKRRSPFEYLQTNNIHEKICSEDVLNFTDSELSSQLCARD